MTDVSPATGAPGNDLRRRSWRRGFIALTVVSTLILITWAAPGSTSTGRSRPSSRPATTWSPPSRPTPRGPCRESKAGVTSPPSQRPGQPFTVLILGTDSRKGTGPSTARPPTSAAAATRSSWPGSTRRPRRCRCSPSPATPGCRCPATPAHQDQLGVRQRAGRLGRGDPERPQHPDQPLDRARPRRLQVDRRRHRRDQDGLPGAGHGQERRPLHHQDRLPEGQRQHRAGHLPGA